MYKSSHKFPKDLRLGFFKIKELCNSAAYRMIKLQLGGDRNRFWPKQGEKGRRNGYSWEGGETSIRQDNRQQQPRPNGRILPKQGQNKTNPTNPLKGAPGEQL